MGLMCNISASIVVYKNDEGMLKRLFNSFLCATTPVQLYVIDNSPTPELEKLTVGLNIMYVHKPDNPGFGAAHNIAIDLAMQKGGRYHFIVNPDIYFNDDVITGMVEYMSLDRHIGMMMPEILYPDGSVQYLPKLLPKPSSIILRKFKKPRAVYDRFISKYELRSVHRDTIYNAPVLSGCFTLLNLNAVADVGGYDDAYFMYFEDWDLSRRMHQKYKTIYCPKFSVYHEYDSGANKNSKLFKIFLKSAVHFFNKWGWFFDTKRNEINAEVLAQFNK